MANARPTYSHEQITLYFERLAISGKHRKYDVAGLTPDEALGYLSLLQRHHLATIPFENLTIHYSHHRQISIHPAELFKKIIGDNNGRGGYCMENNCLFGTFLRSLGFKLYSAGARVYEGDHWSGWAHMVNLVSIGGSKYHVDVGFGANGPIQPLKLDKSGAILPHLRPASMRLQWRNLPENTDEEQRLWVYEHRFNEMSDFETKYCFTELEFLPADYSLMNYFTSTSPKVLFTQKVIAEKKICGGDDGDELVGSIVLVNNDLKWRVQGKKEREVRLETEEDRLKALEEHFSIRFDEAERQSIRGLMTEITSQQ